MKFLPTFLFDSHIWLFGFAWNRELHGFVIMLGPVGLGW